MPLSLYQTWMLAAEECGAYQLNLVEIRPFLVRKQGEGRGNRKSDFATVGLEMEDHSFKNIFEKPVDVQCMFHRGCWGNGHRVTSTFYLCAQTWL